MKEMKLGVRDYVAFAVLLLLVAVVVYTSFFDVGNLFLFRKVI